MERLFRSLKSEWIPAFGHRSLPEAQRDVADYLMGYYNEQRPHMFNDGLSPVAEEEKLKILSGISWPLQSSAACAATVRADR
jgi:putative transposase